MTRDIWRDARRLENDAIVGDMVRRAEACGIDAGFLKAAACQLDVYTLRHGRSHSDAATPR